MNWLTDRPSKRSPDPIRPNCRCPGSVSEFTKYPGATGAATCPEQNDAFRSPSPSPPGYDRGMDRKRSETAESAIALSVGLLVMSPIWVPLAVVVVSAAPSPIPLLAGAIAGACMILLTTRCVNRRAKHRAKCPPDAL